MNVFSKIVIAIGLLLILYIGFFLEAGEQVPVITIKYRGNLVEYQCRSADEYKELYLKNTHNILYFDGQSFFEEEPYINKESRLASIVKVDNNHIINGDITKEGKGISIVVIVFAMLIMLILFNGIDDE